MAHAQEPSPLAIDTTPQLGSSLRGLPSLADAPGTASIPGATAAPGVTPIQLNLVQAIQARAHMPQGAPVPPTQEIEILDPNVDPTGKPAIIPTIGPDGIARIDIPPSIVVHRYYYTGDRSFQGPMIPGGPSIVVANHPGNGERLYIQLQLPPGAPRVIYTRHAIEYNYGTQSVILTFGAHGNPKISYRQGVPLTDRTKVAATQATASVARLVRRTGLPAASRTVARGAVNVVETSADRAHDIGKAVVTPVIQAAKLIPGINLLTSSAEDRAENEREVLLEHTETSIDQLAPTIPVNR
jgi:hypothetical protein